MSHGFGIGRTSHNGGDRIHVWRVTSEPSVKTGYVDAIAMCQERRGTVEHLKPRFIRSAHYTAALDLLKAPAALQVCTYCREAAIRAVNAGD